MTTTKDIDNPHDGSEFIIASDIMRKFMSMVERVARHSGTALVIGETGTGKETIASTIHEKSLRCSKSFVAINCAALPEHLVESELFGYEKGAFSGADAAKPGLFELANGGTIFLDEIGELDLKVQVKLLRVLDRAPYYRLGGHRKIITDVRVVAATNRNLKEEVGAGRFRKDLYHRLSQFELRVPPLRERPEDIVALAQHFLHQYGEELAFSRDALQILQSYSWPGNVRELQNLVNKVLLATTEPEIGAEEVRQELAEHSPLNHAPLNNAPAGEAPANGDWDDDVAEQDTTSGAVSNCQEAQMIQRALEKTGGRRAEAARQLGISRRTLSRRLREYGFASSRRAALPLGSLSYERQRDLRVPAAISVKLQTADRRELVGTAVDMSTGGMGLAGLDADLSQGCELRVYFQVPDSAVIQEVTATVAWSDHAQGRAGLRFVNVPPATRREMLYWLRKQMTQEGWNVQPEPLEPTAVPSGPTWASVAQ